MNRRIVTLLSAVLLCANTPAAENSPGNDKSVANSATAAAPAERWFPESCLGTLNPDTGECVQFKARRKRTDLPGAVLADMKKKTIAPLCALPERPLEEQYMHKMYLSRDRRFILFQIQYVIDFSAVPNARPIFYTSPNVPKQTLMANRSTIFCVPVDGSAAPMAITLMNGDFCSWLYDTRQNAVYCSAAIDNKVGHARIDLETRKIAYFGMKPWEKRGSGTLNGREAPQGGTRREILAVLADGSVLVKPDHGLATYLDRYAPGGSDDGYTLSRVEFPMLDATRRFDHAQPSGDGRGLLVAFGRANPTGETTNFSLREIWICPDLQKPEWKSVYESRHVTLLGADPNGESVWLNVEKYNGNSHVTSCVSKLDLKTKRVNAVWTRTDADALREKLYKDTAKK